MDIASVFYMLDWNELDISLGARRYAANDNVMTMTVMVTIVHIDDSYCTMQCVARTMLNGVIMTI